MSGKLGPYELNTIIHGDCLEVMPHLPDRSVDMLLSDWPYGTTACEWDSIIPLEPLWEQAKRVIKPGGAIVLTAAQPFTSMLVMSNLSWFRASWIWEKTRASNFASVRHRPLRYHEDILLFSKESCAYSPQMQTGEKYFTRITARGVIGKPNLIVSSKKGKRITRYPGSIIKVPSMRQQDLLHETQKPVALFAYLIRTYSNPGDLILDNAAGSCTTAIAAIDTGRNWLCIEKYPLPGQPVSKTNPDYIGIGRERVRERLAQPFLPGVVETALPQPVQLDLGVSDG